MLLCLLECSGNRTFAPGNMQMLPLGHLVPCSGVGRSISSKPSGFLILFQEVLVFLDSLNEFPESAKEEFKNKLICLSYFQMRILRSSEFKWLVQGLTAGWLWQTKNQSQIHRLLVLLCFRLFSIVGYQGQRKKEGDRSGLIHWPGLLLPHVLHS